MQVKKTPRGFEMDRLSRYLHVLLILRCVSLGGLCVCVCASAFPLCQAGLRKISVDVLSGDDPRNHGI